MKFFLIILYYIFLSFRMFNLDLWAVWKKCENEEQQLANGAKIQKMVSFPVQKKLSLDTFLGPMVVTSWPKEDIALAWTLTSLCKLNLAIFLVWKILNPIFKFQRFLKMCLMDICSSYFPPTVKFPNSFFSQFFTSKCF